jgi:hypothetical protein
LQAPLWRQDWVNSNLQRVTTGRLSILTPNTIFVKFGFFCRFWTSFLVLRHHRRLEKVSKICENFQFSEYGITFFRNQIPPYQALDSYRFYYRANRSFTFATSYDLVTTVLYIKIVELQQVYRSFYWRPKYKKNMLTIQISVLAEPDNEVWMLQKCKFACLADRQSGSSGSQALTGCLHNVSPPTSKAVSIYSGRYSLLVRASPLFSCTIGLLGAVQTAPVSRNSLFSCTIGLLVQTAPVSWNSSGQSILVIWLVWSKSLSVRPSH